MHFDLRYLFIVMGSAGASTAINILDSVSSCSAIDEERRHAKLGKNNEFRILADCFNYGFAARYTFVILRKRWSSLS